MQPRQSSRLPVTMKKETVMNEPTIETLARRLDRVERENRWLKRAGVVAVAVIAAVGLMGQATGSKVAKVIEAEKFVLRDTRGKVRGKLEMHKDGVGLILADEDERPRIMALVAPQLVSLSLLDEAGNDRITLSTLERKVAIKLKDKTGKVSGGLGMVYGGQPTLSLTDNLGKTRVGLFALPRGGAVLTAADASLIMQYWEAPVLTLLDKQNKVIWSAP